MALKEEAWGKVTEEFSSRYLHVNYRVLSFNETIPTCQISLQCISTPTSGDLPRRATKEGALPVATHRVPASTGSIPGTWLKTPGAPPGHSYAVSMPQNGRTAVTYFAAQLESISKL